MFNWKEPEASTLGKLSLRSWYAVILCQRIGRDGLKYIMDTAFDYYEKQSFPFVINKYGDNRECTIFDPRSTTILCSGIRLES